MGDKVAYIDSSAFVKLVIAERELQALRQAFTQWPERVSVALLRTETIRALRRSGNEMYIEKTRRLLESVNLIRIDNPLLDRAGDLDLSGLRSLDALHLAAAPVRLPGAYAPFRGGAGTEGPNLWGGQPGRTLTIQPGEGIGRRGCR